MESNYYVYMYISPITNLPFYVGKGKGRRYLSHLKHQSKFDGNKHKKNKINEILNNYLVPIIEIISSGLTEDDAFILEKDTIEKYGRLNNQTGILCNMTDGGEGQSGWIPSIDYREKMSKSTSGEKNGMYGKTHTIESRKKMSEWQSQKKVSIETKEKMSSNRMGEKNSFYGKSHTDETKKKISNGRTGILTGKDNPSAKTFLFISPDKSESIIIGNFNKFCEENKLSITKMRRHVNKGIIQECEHHNMLTYESKNCFGWEVKYYNLKTKDDR